MVAFSLKMTKALNFVDISKLLSASALVFLNIFFLLFNFELLFPGCWTYWRNFSYEKATASQDLMAPLQLIYVNLWLMISTQVQANKYISNLIVD